MNGETEKVRKVEGVVLDDHNTVVWAPDSSHSSGAQKGKKAGAFQFIMAKPFLMKAAIALLLLPVLCFLAIFAVLFAIIAFFFGRPVRVQRFGARNMKPRSR
ncbi:hypothetical protein GW915_06735 [bacterium]|nr:hypothetical protein [bacterium]